MKIIIALRRRSLPFLLLVSIAIITVISAGTSGPEDSAAGANPDFNSTKAYQYIISNYNSTYGLVRENENINRYWLWTDNLLASHVLRDYDYAMSANMTTTIRYYNQNYDLDFRHPIGSLFDQVAYFNSVTDKNVVNNVWFSDSDGTVELDCSEYGDIAFYKSIYYYKAGRIDDAKSCYEKGSSMFDGIGIRDKAFEPDGQRYSTYKIALWKLASNITGFGEEPKEALTIISYMQNATTGGVYTHYRANLLPDSQTNVETTSLAILAHKGMAFPPASKPPDNAITSEISLPVLLVGMFIVIGFAIILLKRFRK
jgi:tetratricopeptide (TPR) repeat protein